MQECTGLPQHACLFTGWQTAAGACWACCGVHALRTCNCCLAPLVYRVETADYTKAHSSEALELNNRLSQQKKKLQLLQQEAAALEAKQDYSLQVAAQKTLEYGQVRRTRGRTGKIAVEGQGWWHFLVAPSSTPQLAVC